MGILSPAEGNIYIDGVKLFNNKDINILDKWKNNLAHVPQDVFLYNSQSWKILLFASPRMKLILIEL